MFSFYRDCAIVFALLATLSALFVYIGVAQSRVTGSLYPAQSEEFPWEPRVEPRISENQTYLTVKSHSETIAYEFFLDPAAEFPYTHYAFSFTDSEEDERIVDLTEYDSLSFNILCHPKNVLLLVLFSFDDQVTKPDQPITRRVSSTAFSCDTRWRSVTIDLDDLSTPDWWLHRYDLSLSDRGYELSKTMGLALVNSLQSPRDTLSQVRLTDFSLHGREPAYLYAALGLSALLWVGYMIWVMRRYVVALTARLQEKIRMDQPLVAYKKLSIEPQKNKEKSTLLRYMATEYANSELSLDSTASELGINRTKINEILKEELGLTFKAYLKKLRLTEAARLLSQNSDANVSQIAYLVGYNSVSYFNKLFKAEYGCTPKTFQNLCRSKQS